MRTGTDTVNPCIIPELQRPFKNRKTVLRRKSVLKDLQLGTFN